MSNYKGFIKRLPFNTVLIPCKVRDAKEPVEMVRGKPDAITGKVADPERCMNANCAMRHAKDGTFPHPVFGAWFTKRMALFLTSDKPTRGYYQAIRYTHTNWADIKEFDTTANAAERVRKFAGEKRIKLYAITPTRKLGADRHRRSSNHGHGKRGEPTGRVAAPRGMNARFITLRDWEDTQKIAAGARA